MKVEIHLENPNYCKGCDFLVRITAVWFGTGVVNLKCMKHYLNDTFQVEVHNNAEDHIDIPRAKKCIKENGK